MIVRGSSGEQLASLPKLSLEIDYLPLLRGLVAVQALKLDRPDVRIKHKTDGRIDLVEAFQALQPQKKPVSAQKLSFPFAVLIENMLVQNGNFRIDSELNNITSDIQQLTIQARADSKQKTGMLDLDSADTVQRKPEGHRLPTASLYNRLAHKRYFPGGRAI